MDKTFNKAIYFDMDGTIADLYAVENWLHHLENGNTFPYEVARAMCNMAELRGNLLALRELGYTIGVISWTSIRGSKEYNRNVRKAKINWLRNQDLLDAMDEIHIVKYGTPKHTIPKIRHGILIDDNKEVCNLWERYGGVTVNPLETDICEFLRQIL